MPDIREMMKDKKRIVIKIGSSSLQHKETGDFDYTKLDVLVRELCDLRNRGKDVVLVTSGAIAAGKKAEDAGYKDIYKQSLIGITEMERLMGKKRFAEILGAFVYKPNGKITLVPDSDKRETINLSTAEADFKEDVL